MSTIIKDKTDLLRRLDDVLTLLLVDRLFLWFSTRKFQPKDALLKKASLLSLSDKLHCSLFLNVIQSKDIKMGTKELLKLLGSTRILPPGLDIKSKAVDEHIERFLLMYHPDAGYELSSTNQYDNSDERIKATIKSAPPGQACILASREFRKGESISYLQGLFSPLSPEQLEKMKQENSDFSVMLLSRTHRSCLLLGPARFVNHDCNPNTSFHFNNSHSITFKANRLIQFGQEITVSYGGNYFGPGNCECLCVTCMTRKATIESPTSTPSPKHKRLVNRYSTRRKLDVGQNLEEFRLPKKEQNPPYFSKKYKSKESSATDIEEPVAQGTEFDVRLLNERLVGGPYLMEFRTGFKTRPCLFSPRQLQVLLDPKIRKECHWCHNPQNLAILPRIHLPNLFLTPVDQRASSKKVKSGSLTHVSHHIHQLDDETLLCLRCNRHYETYALPWPYRQYPESIRKLLSSSDSVAPPEKKLKRDKSPVITIDVIKDYELVLISRRPAIKPGGSPGLLIPQTTPPTLTVGVYDFTDSELKWLPLTRIHRLSLNDLYPRLNLDLPATRSALAYLETGILPHILQEQDESQKNTAIKYHGQPGNSWMTLFPQEGFSEMPTTIMDTSLILSADSTLKLYYRVQLHGTDTHRWVAPNQLIVPLSLPHT